MSTEQPKPLTGYRESQETKKEITVDEKRFKEELHKVSESEESQQKSKRNLKKSEEEIDDDELAAKKQQIQASGALFAMFMKESAANDLLTPQTPQNIRASQAPTTTSQFSIEQDTEESPKSPPSISTAASPPALAQGGQMTSSKPPLPSYSIQETPTSSFSNQAEQEPQEPPPLPNFEQISQVASQEPAEEQEPTEESYQPQSMQSPKRVEKKEEKDQSLLAKYKPSKAQLQKKTEEKTPEIHLARKKAEPQVLSKGKELPVVAVEKKPAEKEPILIKKQAPLGAKAHLELEAPPLEKGKLVLPEQQPQEQETLPAPTPTPAPQEKKILVSDQEPFAVEGIKTSKPSSDQEPSKDKDKDKQKDEKEEQVILSQPPAPMVFTPPALPETPAYTNLSPQVFELFEKMVGVMTIQENQGITTTTVTVNMKNSIFDGAQIILDHYSSAPNAFNVTIAASPEAQAVLNTNIDNLVASFEASKLSFQINLKRPVLLEEYQAFKRKEKVEAEPDQEQEQKQE